MKTVKGVSARLEISRFHSMCGELKQWRIDPIVQAMESDRAEGRILGFVRGLRLSAQLIYLLRDALSSASLQVDWGHLLHEDEVHCSPECDVIVHKPGWKACWNGSIAPVMDFKFIECNSAVAVISCKSFLASVDGEYPEKMKPYLKEVFLFAECCEPLKVDSLKNAALKAGYKGFYYLYTWDRENSLLSESEEEWQCFLKALHDAAR